MIEVSPSMLDPVDEFTPSSLQMALICAYQLAAQRVITNPSDIMGVLLYGTVSLMLHLNSPTFTSAIKCL